MSDSLEPVSLQELRVLGGPRHWTVETHLEQISTLTPVRGRLSVEHRGNVLAVDGQLETIVTLCCDRCLGRYNHQLLCSPSELIWLGEAPPSPLELQESEDLNAMEGLVECLDPRADFDPAQWAFEQLNLQLPVVNHCGQNCPGPPGLDLDQPSSPDPETAVDPRWEALRRLQPPSP